jgi:3-deoxy-D-manno-octulosonic-acid transferase
MNRILYGAYALACSGLFVSCFPAFYLYSRLAGRYGNHLKERLGFIPAELVRNLAGSPRIWIHAVSLGEVGVAAAIVRALKEILPGCSIIVSTTTEHGRELARKTFEKDIPVIFGPIDFVGSVRKALASVRPDVLVFLETEIWPAWLIEAHRMGIRTALINGRISVRSIGGYLKFRPFFCQILKNVDAFSMITEEDAERMKALGAPANKIQVCGNAKYDFLGDQVDPSTEKDMRQALNLDDTQPVFVAGSTREAEEDMVLDAYKRILKAYPETILIIVPRHVERSGAIGSLVAKRGLGYQLWSDLGSDRAKRTERVIIVDVFGELFRIYSVGTIVFCGASLVPLGGQNPLEAAVWGKPVFYGPSMDDFQDAKAILEKVGAGIPVAGPHVLADKACWFLSHPESLWSAGQRAKEAVMENHNTAQRHARVVSGLIQGQSLC